MRDIEFLGSNMWTVLHDIGNMRSKRIAVAYLSSSEGFNFGPGDVIITNASEVAITSGQTSATVLLMADRNGAQVYSHPKLHAKILCTNDLAVVGSANFSQSSRNLREAGVLVRKGKALSDVQTYLKRLQTEADLLSPKKLAQLASIPVIRTGPLGVRRKRPSLLEALEENSDLLKDIGYTWYENIADFSRTTILRAAKKRHIILPTRGAWMWFEGSNHPGLLTKARSYEGTTFVSWEVKLDTNGNVTQFKPHDKTAALQRDAFRLKDSIIYIMGASPAKTAFDLTKHGHELANVLNKGLEKAGVRLRQEINNNLSIISPRQLVRLFRLGQ